MSVKNPHILSFLAGKEALKIAKKTPKNMPLFLKRSLKGKAKNEDTWKK